MPRLLTLALLASTSIALCGCAPDYSPDIYAANAMQQANKVEPGVVIGYRQVEISAGGTVGAVSGGAAGGILGSEVDASGVAKALSTLGGTVVGGIVGTTIEHAAGDTTGWEYIIRKPNGDLLSVTQREPSPIPVGQKVLVITGNQARVVADYSVALDPPASDKDKTGAKDTKSSAAAEKAPSSTPPVAAAPSAPPSTSIAASPDESPASSSKAEKAAPAALTMPPRDSSDGDPNRLSP